MSIVLYVFIWIISELIRLISKLLLNFNIVNAIWTGGCAVILAKRRIEAASINWLIFVIVFLACYLWQEVSKVGRRVLAAFSVISAGIFGAVIAGSEDMTKRYVTAVIFMGVVLFLNVLKWGNKKEC